MSLRDFILKFQLISFFETNGIFLRLIATTTTTTTLSSQRSLKWMRTQFRQKKDTSLKPRNSARKPMPLSFSPEKKNSIAKCPFLTRWKTREGNLYTWHVWHAFFEYFWRKKDYLLQTNMSNCLGLAILVLQEILKIEIFWIVKTT